MAGTGFKLAGSSPGPLGDRWRRRSLTLPNLSTRGAVIHRSAVCGVPLSVRSRVQIQGPQPRKARALGRLWPTGKTQECLAKASRAALMTSLCG